MSYPYDIERPQSIAQARAQVIAHPASGKAHADLLRLSGQGLNATNRLNELEAAVFVSPTDPYLRDLYAQSLAMAGQPTAALEQITRSVFDSPKFETHFYLSKWITLLSIPEQSAVERGFKEAVAARYPGAVEGLGAFEGDFGRISAEAQLFIDAAAAARSDSERSRYLVAAGLARARAGRDDLAENLFRQAIKAAPSDPEAYRQLISRIYGPAKNWQGAQAVLDEAAREAADPLSMELLLADTAQANGNGTLAESALIRALALRPTYEMYVKVGRFYLENQNLDKAVAILEKATENNPVAADGFYWLASAQEGNYQYSAADRNYARAASLAPQRYNGVHTAFQHRVNRINK
jgi:Tfp pilus assembly protein PilF